MTSRSTACGAFAAAALFVAVLAGGCGDASSPAAPGGPSTTTAPLSDEAGLAAAQNWLVGTLTGEGSRLDVEFIGPALVLPRPCTIDVEYGSAHAGSLVMARLRVGDETTTVERVSYQERRGDAKSGAGEASRAQAPTSSVRPFLDAVRALSRAQVTWRSSDGGGGTSNDFFVLVRACATAPATSSTWEFAGYQSGDNSARYAAPAAVVSMAQGIFDQLAWTPVPAADLRRTHFSDAFERNRDLFVEKFHWWVMERSVEALGWFGDRGALPTVVWFRDHATDLNERRKAKLARVIETPDLYLAGPPREVTDK